MSKIRSWGNAFGRGIAGVFLSFLGIGFILLISHYQTNFHDIIGIFPMYYFLQLPFGVLVIPIIFFIIGGISFYYGIRILAKNH